MQGSRSNELKFKKQLDLWSGYEIYKEEMFGVLIDCCSPLVRSQLKLEPTWNTLDDESDFIGLLNVLESICNAGAFGYQPKRMVHTSNAIAKFLNAQQNKNEDA